MPNSIIGILDLAAHGRSRRFQPDVVVPASHRYGRVHIDAMGMPHVNHPYPAKLLMAAVNQQSIRKNRLYVIFGWFFMDL